MRALGDDPHVIDVTRPDVPRIPRPTGWRGLRQEWKRRRWLHHSISAVLVPDPARFGAFGRSFIVPPLRIDGAEFMFVGDDVQIYEGAFISIARGPDGATPRLQIGDRAIIGRFCQISMCGVVVIEEDVGISDRVLIADTAHEPSADVPWYRSALVPPRPITIKRGAVVDVGAAILPGVTVGVGAYVRPGAVVTRDVPDHVAVAGSPARIVSKR